MSENRLRKYLEREEVRPEGELRFKPVVFSDSKGSYLESVCHEERIGQDILWRIFRGGETVFVTQVVRDELPELVARYGRVHIYLWVGTCDLTAKNGKFVKLRSNQEEAQRSIVRNVLRLEDEIKQNRKVRLTILQLPYYSIKHWNEYYGHENPESFIENDVTLKTSVDVVNGVFEQTNERLRYRAPKFNLDIERTNKAKNKTTRHSINWGLFKDGIHPDQLLAKVWLRSICREILKDCY